MCSSDLNVVHNVTRNAMVKLPEDTDARGWSTFVGDLIEKHNPGIIMYQAGADAWDQDPYGAGYLDQLGMMRRDQGTFDAAQRAGVPLVFNLAGGYSNPMQKVLDIHLSTLMMSDRVYYGTVRTE